MAKKNKGPRVRSAKAGDRNLFRKLWLAYITEAYESKDLTYKPTEKTIDGFSMFFDAYVNKKVEGHVLFVSEAAVLMAGNLPMIFEEDCEAKAVCWGIYVKPEFRRKGYFKLLVDECSKLLKDKFDIVVSGEVKPGSVAEMAARTVGEVRSMSYVTWLK